MPTPSGATDPILDETIAHLQALIRLDTSNPPGNEIAVARYLDEVLRGAELPGKRVMVIDGNGHWEAAGTAEFLADAGHEV
ncbi:MAG: hypothetical protein ACLGIK_01045, partial [Gemmatimonadota bacterium]